MRHFWSVEESFEFFSSLWSWFLAFPTSLSWPKQDGKIKRLWLWRTIRWQGRACRRGCNNSICRYPRLPFQSFQTTVQYFCSKTMRKIIHLIHVAGVQTLNLSMTYDSPPMTTRPGHLLNCQFLLLIHSMMWQHVDVKSELGNYLNHFQTKTST